MLPLTLAIIAQDEADRIERAISSVPGVAEVLVLDSGSTDNTVALAEAAGARVIGTDWPGYGAQKNRALKEATQPWVLSLDADEWLSPELLEAVRQAVASPGEAVGFSVLRRNRWLGVAIRGGTMGPSWKLRLVRKEAGHWVGGILHETLEATGAVDRLQGLLEHDPYRSEADQQACALEYSKLFAEKALAEGRRARFWDLALRPALHFVKSILWRAGFRDGLLGWRLAWMGAGEVAMKWRQLRKIQQGEESS